MLFIEDQSFKGKLTGFNVSVLATRGFCGDRRYFMFKFGLKRS
jgi:hypothetical protein